MIMWARDRGSTLAADGAGNVVAVSRSRADTVPATPPATKRIVAISSAGVGAPAVSEAPVAQQVATTTAPSRPRRPGVGARWKEQNRVPYPRTL